MIAKDNISGISTKDRKTLANFSVSGYHRGKTISLLKL